jgi:hypothetical protein
MRPIRGNGTSDLQKEPVRCIDEYHRNACREFYRGFKATNWVFPRDSVQRYLLPKRTELYIRIAF